MGIFLSRKMHYFMVLMDKKSFTKAAEELCITRSPLSKVVTEIEETLGGRLFHRKHNELEPTDLAQDYYIRCKQLYSSLLSLDNEHKTQMQPKRLDFRFDISTPEIFVRYISSIAKSVNINVNITREMITINDLSALPTEANQVIFSLRPLGGANLVSCDSWEGSNIVKLSSRYNKENTGQNFFIWKDNYHSYFENRYSSLLEEYNIKPTFLEHNYDIATLLFMVNTGKGSVITTEKFSQWYRVEGIEIERLRIHPRCHLYHNGKAKNKTAQTEMKALIAQFI